MKTDASSSQEQMPVSNNRHLLLYEQQSSQAGVDTLKFYTDDFHISSDANVQILPHLTNLNGETEERTALFQDSAGREHFGQKAFINTDRYNLTVKSGYLFIQLNANKLNHPYEINTDRKQREAQILDITNAIQQSGVDCDFDNMNVSRLDLCKQKQLQHSLLTYHSVFSSLSAKRQISRSFGDTFLYLNKSRGTQFYDKSIEQEIPNTENLIRAELQLKNSKAVRGHSPIKTLSELLKCDSEELTHCYNKNLQDTLFNKTTEHDISTDYELIKILRNQYPRAFLDKYLSLVGLPAMIERFKSIDAFCDVLERIGVERSAVYRRKKALSKHFQEYQLMKEKAEDNAHKLFTEIYSFAA